MSRPLHVATVQPALVMRDTAGNLARIRRLLHSTALTRPLDLLVLPEIFNGWPAAQADPCADDARRFVGELARELGCIVVGGSLGWTDSGGARRNLSVVCDRTGREVGQYAKRVPFGLEQGRIEAGEADGVFECNGVRVAVLICGDLWRPELAAVCMRRADVLCVPTRTGVANELHALYARTLWWNLALVRGMETGLPVIVSDWAATRHDAPEHPHQTAGGASIVDPSGRPDIRRVQLRREDGGECVLRATIDLEAVEDYRAYRRSVGLLPP